MNLILVLISYGFSSSGRGFAYRVRPRGGRLCVWCSVCLMIFWRFRCDLKYLGRGTALISFEHVGHGSCWEVVDLLAIGPLHHDFFLDLDRSFYGVLCREAFDFVVKRAILCGICFVLTGFVDIPAARAGNILLGQNLRHLHHPRMLIEVFECNPIFGRKFQQSYDQIPTFSAQMTANRIRANSHFLPDLTCTFPLKRGHPMQQFIKKHTNGPDINPLIIFLLK